MGILAVLLAGALSFALDEYAKGAVRAATEAGAQAGAEAGGSTEACQLEAARVMGDLLRGTLGSDIHITCIVEGPEMEAEGTGMLPTLVPAVPSIQVDVVGVAPVQVAPVQ